VLFTYTCLGKPLREHDIIAKLSVEIRSMEVWREGQRVRWKGVGWWTAKGAWAKVEVGRCGRRVAG
jgi:hypothetical protein